MKINNFNSDNVGEIIPFMGIILKIFVPTILLSFLKKSMYKTDKYVSFQCHSTTLLKGIILHCRKLD